MIESIATATGPPGLTLHGLRNPRLGDCIGRSAVFASVSIPSALQARRKPDTHPAALAAKKTPGRTIDHTLKLRGHNPTKTIADALQHYLATGKLPPRPAHATANG
jgi:hypothetical protein